MTTQTTDVRLTAGDAELLLRPSEGCRTASLRVGGKELLLQGLEYGSFVMAPWCGRTARGRFRNGADLHQLPLNDGEHALHGLVHDRPWRTVRADERSAAFVCELGDPWPWAATVNQVVELDEDGSGVAYTLSVETYDNSFPAQAGWHPWFRRNLGLGGRDVQLDFAPAWREERGPDHIPTGHRLDEAALATEDAGTGRWDDCFGMPDGVDATLTWPDELELRITSRAEWVVVYDKPDDAVCVEPQSGPPNGLNTHPQLITPIAPLELGCRWSWRTPQ
ncbi:aldose 1-epimerase [Streptomyces sp. P38-E01]|uniref:Aldose 1-epimerase n=1 Tax=Streptomyces tardus TaxID=2780544 RepID=A0A949JFB2_9ACTN|nr:aldose 1-epimerase [Streptomyces tardus]MBU7597510.1 aldose 1-epimerase [Streptomyces tardus]